MKWISLLLFFSLNASAAEWIEVKIPGARCGDKKDYVILLQKQASDKIMFEFMGGGVCWDYDSCFKRTAIFPWMHNYPVINSYSVLTANYSSINPLKNHSKVYFPYCTGDVFAGSHVSYYENKIVYHYGKRNIDRALEYLRQKPFIDFSKVNDLVVFGASAGGIASLVFGKKIEGLFPENIKKTMIADSPGLHYGKTFWNKFDKDMKNDFKVAFSGIGLDVDFNDGAVSKKMAPVFDNYTDWKVGFIYGLEDYAMSKIYGDISPEKQKELILGPSGIPAVAKNYSNIHVWMKDTKMHTFMLTKATASMESEEGVKAHEFVKDLYEN